MARILIVYSTTDGQTRRICERLQQVMQQHSHAVTLTDLAEQPDIDIARFDKVVVGASIRYGKHQPQVFDFVRTNRAALERKPNAFFSVNVVARKPGKNTPDTNPYVRKFLRRTAWRPTALAVFAGKIDYALYRFWDRQIIRFIMWMTDGPTDPKAVVEFTHWPDVEAFGHRVAHM